MAKSKKVDYFLKPGALPLIDDGIIVGLDAGGVYTAIEAILGTTARSFWGSDAEYREGRSRMTRLAGSLLMDATDRFIRAIWEMRGVPDATLTPTELGLYPVAAPGTTIAEAVSYLSGVATSTASIDTLTQEELPAIRELLEQMAEAAGGWTAEEKAQLLGDIAGILLAL